jgi:WD40 repeat protein
MAQVQRHRSAIAAALLGLVALAFAPALAEDQGPNAGTDLYDRPVLAIDPGMHTAPIRSQAVDAVGRFAVTGSDDRTVRIWSVADGKLLRTIWIPVGPENVGDVYAVAISPDGSTIAAGGWNERLQPPFPIYLVDRESGNLIRRIGSGLPEVTDFLTFSPDGRYLAATLGGENGLRVFDRDKDWSEAFRDDQYGDSSYGASFARDGRHLVTTAYDGLIRLYKYDPNADVPKFHDVGKPVTAPSGHRPFRISYSPDGKRLAVGYNDAAVVDVLDGTALSHLGRQTPVDASPAAPDEVAWSSDGRTLFAAGGGYADSQGNTRVFAWDQSGLDAERRMPYCAVETAAGVDPVAEGRVFVASAAPCLSLIDAYSKPIWTVGSPLPDSVTKNSRPLLTGALLISSLATQPARVSHNQILSYALIYGRSHCRVRDRTTV